MTLRSKKRLNEQRSEKPSQIMLETVAPLANSFDHKMASPYTSVEKSIAFGVMYHPRTRVQRTDEFNCDTRVLREPGSDGIVSDFIDVGPEPEF